VVVLERGRGELAAVPGLPRVEAERTSAHGVGRGELLILHVAVVPFDIADDALRNDGERAVRQHGERVAERAVERDGELVLAGGLDARRAGNDVALVVRLSLDVEHALREVRVRGVGRLHQSADGVDDVVGRQLTVAVLELDTLLERERVLGEVVADLVLLDEEVLDLGRPVVVVQRRVEHVHDLAAACGVARVDGIERVERPRDGLERLLALELVDRRARLRAGAAHTARRVVVDAVVPERLGDVVIHRQESGRFPQPLLHSERGIGTRLRLGVAVAGVVPDDVELVGHVLRDVRVHVGVGRPEQPSAVRGRSLGVVHRVLGIDELEEVLRSRVVRDPAQRERLHVTLLGPVEQGSEVGLADAHLDVGRLQTRADGVRHLLPRAARVLEPVQLELVVRTVAGLLHDLLRAGHVGLVGGVRVRVETTERFGRVGFVFTAAVGRRGRSVVV